MKLKKSEKQEVKKTIESLVKENGLIDVITKVYKEFEPNQKPYAYKILDKYINRIKNYRIRENYKTKLYSTK